MYQLVGRTKTEDGYLDRTCQEIADGGGATARRHVHEFRSQLGCQILADEMLRMTKAGWPNNAKFGSKTF